MASATRSVSDNLSSTGEAIGRRVADMAEHLGPQARDYVDRSREYGEQAQSVARSAMRTRPLTVIAVAVAFGFALGSIWR